MKVLNTIEQMIDKLVQSNESTLNSVSSIKEGQSMSEEYKVLRATNEQGQVKTMLVNTRAFEGKPEGYFTPEFRDTAEEVGVVQMLGDTDEIGDTYEEAW